MSQFRENLQTDGRTDGRMDRRTDRPYFIGPFRSRPGVQNGKALAELWVRLKNALNIFIESNAGKYVKQLHLSLFKRDEFSVQYDKYFQSSYFMIYVTRL